MISATIFRFGGSAVRVIWLFFFVIVAKAEASPHWKLISPEGGTISDLRVAPSDPDFVYAGVERRGVFASTDGGRHWKRLNSHPSMIWSTYKIAVSPRDPRTVWVAGQGRFIYGSSDGGKTWRTSDLGSEVQRIDDLRVSAKDDQVLYASGYRAVSAEDNFLEQQSVVLGSGDGGRTWKTLDSWPVAGTAYALAVDPRHSEIACVAVDNYYELPRGRVYRTINGGATWQRSDAGIPDEVWIYGIEIDERSGALYAVAGMGLYVSRDGARTWQWLSNDLPQDRILGLTVDPVDSALLYLGTERGAFGSRDYGETWTRLGGAGQGEVSRVGVRVMPHGRELLAGTGHLGVQRLAGGTGDWLSSNTGLMGCFLRTAAFDASSPGVILAGGPSGIWKSRDGGTSWNDVLSVEYWDEITALALVPGTPSTVYATSLMFWISTDGGDTWRRPPGGYSPMPCKTIVATPRHVFTMGMNELLQGSLDGESWRSLPLMNRMDRMGKPYFDLAGALTSDPSNPDRLWGAKYGRGVSYSADGGETWKHEPQGPASKDVNEIAIDPRNPQTMYLATYSGISKSSDGGATWVRSGLDGYDVVTITVDPRAPDLIYAGTYRGYPFAGGVFRSTNGGDTWEPINDGLEELNLWRLIVDPSGTGDVLAVTFEGGLYKLER